MFFQQGGAKTTRATTAGPPIGRLPIPSNPSGPKIQLDVPSFVSRVKEGGYNIEAKAKEEKGEKASKLISQGIAASKEFERRVGGEQADKISVTWTMKLDTTVG